MSWHINYARTQTIVIKFLSTPFFILIPIFEEPTASIFIIGGFQFKVNVWQIYFLACRHTFAFSIIPTSILHGDYCICYLPLGEIQTHAQSIIEWKRANRESSGPMEMSPTQRWNIRYLDQYLITVFTMYIFFFLLTYWTSTLVMLNVILFLHSISSPSRH